MIPQKYIVKVTDGFFLETYPECSLPSTVSKTTKLMGHHACFGDVHVLGQSSPIYACTRANRVHYSSVHILQ